MSAQGGCKTCCAGLSLCGEVRFWVSDALRSLVCPSSCVVWVQSLWGMLCTHSLSAPERAVLCCAASHASAESAEVAGRPKWAQRQPGLSQLCIRQHITWYMLFYAPSFSFFFRVLCLIARWGLCGTRRCSRQGVLQGRVHQVW